MIEAAAAPELEELWKNRAGEHIAPYMKRVKAMLVARGLSDRRITTKVVDGKDFDLWVVH